MRFQRALAVAVTTVAVLGGLSGPGMGEEARARPSELLALSPSVCVALLTDDTIPLDCFSMYLPISLRAVAALASPDSDPTVVEPDDFTAIDLDADQIHREDGQLFILAFVSDDAPVTFHTDAGMFDRTSLWGDEGREWVCDTEDADCNNDGVRGDGVAVAWLWPCESGNPMAGTCPERSELGSGTVRVEQGTRAMSLDFDVVGEPEKLELTAVEKVIQSGLDIDSCPLETTEEGFAEAVAAPAKTAVLARALDSEGTEVTGAFIRWETDDRHRAIVAGGVTPTLDLAGVGIVGGNILCGSDETGPVKATGRIVPLGAGWDGSLCYEGPDCPFKLDPSAGDDRQSAGLTVVGPPAGLEITVEPASLLCDGTASATVSVAATDADGASVADGNDVRFDVRVLATADPVVATTANGGAASTVVPLSSVMQGVPIRVTVGDVQESVLLTCEETAAAPEPSPSPPAPPIAPSPTAQSPIERILPPMTGSGGQAAR